MKKLLFIAFIILMPTFVNAQDDCVKISGTWSTKPQIYTRAYREVIKQNNCESISIESYVSEGTLVETKQITMNGEWICEIGTPDKRHCYKGEWVGADNIFITEATFQEGCLTITETTLDDINTLRSSHPRASCAVDLGDFGKGWSKVWRVENAK
ncbi:MAG: hypothetical protein KAR83_07230 [Thermodesulfovibrionales bacterium]|nr:hypothetical protein [Thermodesulfovibrionales bacterium]